MTDCKDIKYCSLQLLKVLKNKKSVVAKYQGKIVRLFEIYIDKLIFNISAICALICLKIGLLKVHEKHVIYLMEYVDKLCLPTKKAKASRKRNGRMRGGVFNTASFYGDVENAYKVENEGSDIMKVDFANNLARPALGQVNMSGGGCNKIGGRGCSYGGNRCGLKSSITNGGIGKRTTKRTVLLFSCKKLNIIINRKLKVVFRHYGVAVNKSSFKILVIKFNTILTELINKFSKVKGDITLSKAKAVFKNYKIMKNDI